MPKLPKGYRREIQLELYGEKVTAVDKRGEQAAKEDTSRDHFVSAVDAGRVELVDGPYRTQEEARSNIDDAIRKLIVTNPETWFYSWGTVSVDKRNGFKGLLQKNGLK